MSDELDRLQSELAEKRAQAEPRLTEIESAKAKSDNWNRVFIVACVVGVYVFTLFAAIIYLFFKGMQPGSDTFNSMAEILKIGIIPIVTLVIGYYFSRKD